jgi:DNA-binding transcriptional regulator of glucitol operon
MSKKQLYGAAYMWQRAYITGWISVSDYQAAHQAFARNGYRRIWDAAVKASAHYGPALMVKRDE